jgi:phosphoribosyl 1,2-cyclic phosphodiesterase
MVEHSFVFYGVRGSYPVPSKNALKYGGNTSCVLIEAGGDIAVLDAGTGIIQVGKYLKKHKPQRKHINIFLTHLHIDHIMGFPFFAPVFDKEYVINIHCDEHKLSPLEKTIYSLFNQPLSPIGNAGIKATINFKILDKVHPKPVTVGEHIRIDYIKEHFHPITGVMIYKVTIEGKQLVYATDIESPDGFLPEHLEFIKGVDVLIHDSMYFDSDYNYKPFPKKGFGHSTVSMAVANAIKGEVKRLILFHYNPNYSDDDVDRMHAEAKEMLGRTEVSKEMKKFSLRR